MKQVILHIPHSSINIPLIDGYVTSKKVLRQEILRYTDWYTDDLFYSKDDIMIVADFSRIFCDPERFSDDNKEIMSQFGMGVLYEKNDEGQIIRNVSPALRQKILINYYWKHHKKLYEAVKCEIQKSSSALIIDCHSFPNLPFLRDLNQSPNRPDFNIGTDTYHTSQNLIDVSIKFFNVKGYSLGVNWPYKGSLVPYEYYKKNKNVQTIMLEVNRKLYLNNATNVKSEKYHEIKNIIRKFINVLKTFQCDC